MEIFQLNKHQTTVRQEIIAGLVSFFTVSYIIVTNPVILSETGLPPELTVFSTILIAAIGCFIMGVFANTPLVMAPSMGENAFFTYTMVAVLGMTYQQSLAGVFFSGILFMLIVYTGLINHITLSIPPTLKKAIPIGIGLFLVLIGLKNGGLVQAGEGNAGLLLADLSEPLTLLVWFNLLFTAILVKKKVKGSFLIGMAIFSVLSLITGAYEPQITSFSLRNISELPSIVGAFDFSVINQVEFWIAVFSLTLLLLFGAIGMIEGMIEDADRGLRSFKVASGVVVLSAILGTSPAIPLAESASGISEGGKTGLTAVTTGVLFLLSLFFTPLLSYIPPQAIGPVLILTGASMANSIRYLSFDEFSEWFPAFLLIIMMPFTGSIIDGIAIGFITYIVMKLGTGKQKDLNFTLVLISLLFLAMLFFRSFYNL